jgi:hydrogenase maturation factor
VSEFHCITCGDDGEHHTVEIGLVDAEVGTEVLVHAGVALVTVP